MEGVVVGEMETTVLEQQFLKKEKKRILLCVQSSEYQQYLEFNSR